MPYCEYMEDLEFQPSGVFMFVCLFALDLQSLFKTCLNFNLDSLLPIVGIHPHTIPTPNLLP